MREFLKFDIFADILALLSKRSRRIKKLFSAISIGWILFGVISVIWSLVPKYDSLPEVDAEELLNSIAEKAENEDAQEESEELIPVFEKAKELKAPIIINFDEE